MGDLWLKIKVWTKGIVVFVLFLYAAFFIVKNLGNQATVWLSYGKEITTSTLTLAVLSFAAGVVGHILFRTTRATLRQMRELKERRLKEQFRREHEEMMARTESMSAKLAATPPPAAAPSPTVEPGGPPPQDRHE